MDWSRAKTILIIIFLLLNMYLLMGISISRLDRGVTVEAMNNTRTILNNKSIVLPQEIPEYTSKIPSLVYENHKLDRNIVAKILLGEEYNPTFETEKGQGQSVGTKTLFFDSYNSFTFVDKAPDGSINISEKEEVEGYIRDIMQDMGLEMSSYTLDNYKEKDEDIIQVHFTEKYMGFMVFDNYIDVELGTEGIRGIQFKYRKVKGFLDEGIKPMPIYQVLLKNYMNESHVVITDIDLGFKGYELDMDTKELSESPVWRIMSENSPPQYYRVNDGKPIVEED